MSKLISRLPMAIRKRALECQRNENNKWDKETDRLDDAFSWVNSVEGITIWEYVDFGNYQPFYTFHNIEPTKRGRPKTYAETTTTVSFRVPESKVDTINTLVNGKLKEWAVKK